MTMACYGGQTVQPNPKFILLSLLVLSACSSKPKIAADMEPTLKTLAAKTTQVLTDPNAPINEARAIEAYRKFLEVAPKATQRAEALRRIGDLEMDKADSGSDNPSSTAEPDYREAISRYQEFLTRYPADPSVDRVLYQLARAQEQSGALDAALSTLNRLVSKFPNTPYFEEAQFRRGELLFTSREYATAEQAYATVLSGGSDSRYHDRALYMQGWSQYKQAKLETAVESFLGVLDHKIGSNDAAIDFENDTNISRADRELIEDTFRVTSLSLANLQGAESIPAYINSEKRIRYENRVYENLGDLYLKQDRIKDAADTYGLFARLKPVHARAPILQARVIDVYASNGFSTLALQAKKDYVVRYGKNSAFQAANPSGWEQAQPLVKLHMGELARHYHAAAQKSKASADYQEAALWYRQYLDAFPSDPDSAQNNFLLAELLFEDARYAQATVEYEKTAYAYPNHAKASDAGYAALLGYSRQLKAKDPSPSAEEALAIQKQSIASALRFADHFPGDSRVASVLTDAAEKLYALKDNEEASRVAQKVLGINPPAPEAQRKVAWTVVAYTAFEAARFAPAETAFAELLKITPAKAPERPALVERIAASVYKQGEAARSAGQLQEAAGHFERVADVAPDSTVRPNAQYDAAALRMTLKDWDGAARGLEDFRNRFPKHALQADVGNKLSLVYLEKGQWTNAATEFERLAASHSDPAIARSALWQAAELHQKSGARPTANKTYERYLNLYPKPLETALEARYRMAQIAKEDGNTKREFALMKDIYTADQTGGASRTDRTRFLGATSALAMAEPVADAFRKIALTEPLQKQLKLKKTKMEEALKAYAVATDYGVADITTAATYRIATIYHDFSKALLTSERPKKLSKVEREQYNVLLEEQAFPFEEKATDIHETNARRAASGIYDSWVKSSFDALRSLRPVRYGKTERSEGAIDAIQ
jgi:cellulose synthase operon protein C